MGREDQLNGAYGPSDSYGPHPLRTTDHFLDTHPGVAEQLNQNPNMVDNRQYIAQHPELNQYLHNHPYARQESRSQPYRYMRHENRYQRTH